MDLSGLAPGDHDVNFLKVKDPMMCHGSCRNKTVKIRLTEKDGRKYLIAKYSISRRIASIRMGKYFGTDGVRGIANTGN